MLLPPALLRKQEAAAAAPTAGEQSATEHARLFQFSPPPDLRARFTNAASFTSFTDVVETATADAAEVPPLLARARFGPTFRELESESLSIFFPVNVFFAVTGKLARSSDKN